MAYKVIRTFADAEDDGRVYKKGQEYPHKDLKPKPTADRIKQLASADNNSGAACIEKIQTKSEALEELAADSKK
ncbi:hypothetical protein [Enterococcus pallens]|uniref:Uncharacterized protein n=1 Tax=Enterococcus pallens ATCC BAA-351 TaxID=1158607 RepID=R2SPW6_9ENTE|nr:hypothetical protein [Enterococcus pallens]EOH94841.1 hypothetical protein UAU_01763 [Enterococcus pallens ATCC BAA-351]EOU14840.1 hypothetical protein I588_04490 [Enterococcus pallens ATCC BAA-351]OJG76216.1 hypothetical protein RV10_GL004123 [Enterococcus pallens]